MTRIDVYETLCPKQMLVHKGDQINNVQLITGMGSAEMSHLQNCSVEISKEHCWYFTNQRTNGPVNAHLISGPTVSRKKKFCQFWHGLKMGQGQLRVIIYINYVELEHIMLHANFHDHRTISSVEDF